MYSSATTSGRKRSGKVTEVGDPSLEWIGMEPHWELVEALQGGTFAIRKKHRKYLPQEPRELDESFDARLQRSCVQPYLTRIERLLAGMLTRKPVRLTDVSDVITEHLFDVDLGGNNLDVFLLSLIHI